MGVEYNFFNHYRMLYYDLGKTWWAPHLNLRAFSNGQTAFEEVKRAYVECKKEDPPEEVLENLTADLMTLCGGHNPRFFEIHHDMDDFDLMRDDEGYVCIGDRYDGIDPKYQVDPDEIETVILCLSELSTLCGSLRKDVRRKREDGTEFPDRSQQIWSCLRKVTVPPNIAGLGVSELLREDWKSLQSILRGLYTLKEYDNVASAREVLLMLRYSSDLFYKLVRRFVPPVYPLAEQVKCELSAKFSFLRRAD